jgi:hypothetical protein
VVYVHCFILIKYECSIIVFKPKITSFYQLRISLVGDQQYGGKKCQISTLESAFSAIVGVSLKCVF